MQTDKNKRRQANPTPLPTRIFMAAIAIIVVVGFFFFFGGADFPMEISFEKLH